MNNGLGFYIGKFFVAYYGLFLVCGLSLALFLAYFKIKKNGLDFEKFALAISICSLFALFGAKLLYLVLEFKNIDFTRISDPVYLNGLMSGGFVFYGALLGGIPGFYFVYKVFHINIKEYIPSTVFMIPLVHGFGRLGCYAVGCCHGIPYKSSLSILYTNSLFAPNHVPLFPVQPLEAICNFLLAGFLFFFSKKQRTFEPLYLYFIIYGIIRFSLEMFRGDARRGFLYTLSTSQYISLLLITVGVFALLLARAKKKRED